MATSVNNSLSSTEINNITISLTDDKNKVLKIFESSDSDLFPNIIEVITFLHSQVWIPVAKNSLSLSEEDWQNLMPDRFELISPEDVSDNIEEALDIIFDNIFSDLSSDIISELHKEFYNNQQPITISYKDFYSFCKKFHLLGGI